MWLYIIENDNRITGISVKDVKYYSKNMLRHEWSSLTYNKYKQFEKKKKGIE